MVENLGLTPAPPPQRATKRPTTSQLLVRLFTVLDRQIIALEARMKSSDIDEHLLEKEANLLGAVAKNLEKLAEIEARQRGSRAAGKAAAGKAAADRTPAAKDIADLRSRLVERIEQLRAGL